MEFRLLGPLEVIRDGERVRLGGPRERAVLAALLLRANEVASVGYLIDAVWDLPPASPETNLRTYLTGLRRRLGTDRFVTRAGGYLMKVSAGELDLTEFGQCTAQARAATDPSAAAVAYRQALGLWRGTALAGESYGAALRADVARLSDLRIGAVEDYARARLDSGEAAEVVEELARFSTEFPLREELWALRIRALCRAGRKADALAAYRTARDLLRDELGIDPGPGLQRLHQQLLDGDPAAGASRPAQLPADLAGFTGRSTELDRLTAAVDAQPAAVVVTALNGMGGIGKTALATRFAHSIRSRFPDGQLFIDLHAHTTDIEPVEPVHALESLLRALGVPGAEIPPELDQRAALYRSRLADRRVLVLLDNAASERQVVPLLPGAPGCLVLITSRHTLGGIDNLTPVPVDVLPLDDAVALFRTVAGNGRLDAEPAELVEEVVGMCGQLPLAIRIAAARLRDRPSWPLSRLAERLRNEQHRLAELAIGDRSVAGTLALSYRDLPADQQRMFRYLGLHPGAEFDAYAAAALAGCPVEQAERCLENLLDAHLLQRTSGRYRLHDLLRTHAAATVVRIDSEPDRRAATGRLLDHYTHATAAAMDILYPAERPDRPEVAPGASPTPVLADEAAARRWVDQELANLLAAARHAAANGWPAYTVDLAQILAAHLRTRYDHDRALLLHAQARECAVELADPAAEFAALHALGDLHRTRAEYEQAGERYREAIALTDGRADRAAVFAVLFGLGNLERLGGRLPTAVKFHLEALELAREVGQRSGEARILNGLGVDHLAAGNHRQAERYHDQALEIAVEIGDRAQECLTLGSLARLYQTTGRIDQAIAYDQRALVLARELGDRRRELRAILGMGETHFVSGRYAEALEAYQATLALARELGDRMHEAETLKLVGEVHDRMGDHDRAVEYQQASLEMAIQLDIVNIQFEALLSLGSSLRGQGRLSESLARGTDALRIAQDIGQRHDEGRALDEVAATCLALGEEDRARGHWQQALRIFTELDTPERPRVEEKLAAQAAGRRRS